MYSAAQVDDFEYYNILTHCVGGTVALVKKKTTQNYYAMKIVNKQHLLKTNKNCLNDVDTEVRVLKAISHPFIIGMAYSFQNPIYCMIVMDLATGITFFVQFVSYVDSNFCRWIVD